MGRPRKGEEKDRPKHIGFRAATWVWDGVQQLAAKHGRPPARSRTTSWRSRSAVSASSRRREVGRREPGAGPPYKIPSQIASRESLKIQAFAMSGSCPYKT